MTTICPRAYLPPSKLPPVPCPARVLSLFLIRFLVGGSEPPGSSIHARWSRKLVLWHDGQNQRARMRGIMQHRVGGCDHRGAGACVLAGIQIAVEAGEVR